MVRWVESGGSERDAGAVGGTSEGIGCDGLSGTVVRWVVPCGTVGCTVGDTVGGTVGGTGGGVT